MNGCKVACIKLEGKSAVFYLEKLHNGLVDEWKAGFASGNVTEYYKSYKSLLEQVKELMRNG